MGLLDQSLSNVFGVGQRSIAQPAFESNDFDDGFIIREYVDGIEQKSEGVSLKGPFMPHVPFQFGGEQRLVTEYYPGNSEPTVHVLGPKEKDLTVKGHFRLKKFKSNSTVVDGEDPRLTGEAYQRQLDAIRIRGSLLKIELGEWHRWGFLQDVDFEFKNLSEISYTLKFLIVGFNPPKNSKIFNDTTEPIVANKDLINAASDAIDNMSLFPTTMNQGISDFLTTQISSVASAIAIVTGFVDGVLDDADKLNASVNRAIGLIKNARATIARTIRRVGALSNSVSSMGASFSSEWQKTTATIQSVNHTQEMKRQMFSLLAFLAVLQAHFEFLTKSVPMFRHLVKSGDTLQNISIKYYHSPDHWKDIYDHNKLSSTNLTVGSILEIPKI